MNNYLHFSTEDFAQDEYFIGWVASTNIEKEAFWQNWLETYPFKRMEVEAARQLVLIAQRAAESEISDYDIQVLKESVFEKIETIENKGKRIAWKVPLWAAAAVVTALLGLALLYNFTNQRSSPKYSQLVSNASKKYVLNEVENKSKVTMLVNLPDGSSAILRKGSKLSYPNHFGLEAREVFLTGEAFFEIVRSPQRPFYVYTNEVTTKVLGTSFNVRAYQDDKEVLVSVKTGRVSVLKTSGLETGPQEEKNFSEGLMLLPNQQAVFEKGQTNLVKQTKSQPGQSDGRHIDQMRFEYNEKTIAEIFSQLEQAYNISFVYDSTVIGDCPVTASLTGEPFNQKLNLICKAVRAKYEIVNGKVIVTGDGCK
ncbi:FecR family protein [Dyadobacter sp. CY323]|uniref:FecR family protein n=1 Tax=Dyadobacter sp. CY323 TaxID=2907302 RepID=UPI001F38DD34|nr:FecR family protein [Dyadobacter sp. CY323]MCE6989793.1 FecR domain-containing protein [Dyadobacter sp. CY323]